MSYDFYRILHFSGFFFTFFALGIVWLHVQNSPKQKTTSYKLAMMLHGIGVTAILVAGFGMMAKAKFSWEMWLNLKLAIWFIIAASPTLLKKVPAIVKPMIVFLPLIGVLAAYLARFKLA